MRISVARIELELNARMHLGLMKRRKFMMLNQTCGSPIFIDKPLGSCFDVFRYYRMLIWTKSVQYVEVSLSWAMAA